MDTRFFHYIPLVRSRFRVRTRLPGAAWGRYQRMATQLAKLILPAAFVVLAMVNVDFLDRMPNMCVYQTLFHVRCLGCGMTHAFCSVLHGQFAAALTYNPLVIIAFPIFGTLAIRQFGSFLRNAIVEFSFLGRA